MSIIRHREYFRLQVFKDWFFEQSELPPILREKHYGVLTSHWDNNYRNLKVIGLQIMAKKQTTKKPYVFKGYANISIPEKFESDVAAFIANTEEVFMQAQAAQIAEYTIKSYFDEKSECFKSTMTCMNMDDPNGGYSMSAFADDWLSAIGVALYKHVRIADKDWTSYQQSAQKRFG